MKFVNLQSLAVTPSDLCGSRSILFHLIVLNRLQSVYPPRNNWFLNGLLTVSALLSA